MEEKGPFSTLDQTKVITKSQAVVKVATSKSEMQTRSAMETTEVALEVAKKVAVMDEIVAWATTAATVSLRIEGGNTLAEAAVAVLTTMTSER